MSDLQERLSRLTPAQRAELERRLLQRASAGAAANRIPRRNPDLPCPLSFSQRRLWFMEQLEPGNAAYHIAVRWELRGALDAAALRAAFEAVAQRHEAMRTVFHLQGGEPIQVVLEKLPAPFAEQDLRSVAEDGRETAWEDACREQIRQPFDLAQGPLFRVLLARLSDQDYRMLLVIHHIISDGWTMGILWKELSQAYTARLTGAEPGWPKLEIQFPDYAQWQRSSLQGAELEKHLEFWKHELAGAPTVVDLPFDRPVPPIRDHAGARHHFQIPSELLEELRGLARSEGVSLFMLLLAAFQVLLHRYTRQNDLLVGTPVANRGRTEVEPLIGFFVNTLVLRGRLEGDPSFRDLLRRTRETCLRTFARQDLPFERMIEDLHQERSLGHNPVFQVMFSLQNAPRTSLELPGVEARREVVRRETSMFDLTFDLTETAEGLGCWMEYAADVFDLSTIARMAGHYETLLRGLVADPEQTISALPLLPEPERRQLLVEWNDTETPLPEGACLHRLFADQARRTPEAPAVVWRGESWTYAELDMRSDTVARRLRGRGVGPESRVGICLERTPRMIAAVLGVLKAGGAYVPLDPAYPRDRLEFMLQDAEVAVLITEQELACGLAHGPAPVLFIDAEETPPPDPPAVAEEKEVEASNRNLAYVMYTSGSTGRPKGVAVEHRSVVALIEWSKSVVGPEEIAGVLGSTSLCFDLSVFEIFATLCRGGALVLAENLLELPELPDAGRVTLVNTVPSILAELLRRHALPAGVRTAILCGEPLSAELVDTLYAQGVERVYDLYGPTEDTVYSTWVLRRPGGPVTIGRPIANTEAYVLDPRRQPVPIGVPGELHLGGAGLARGYLHRPELTAERFVPHPFREDPEARLYRTGDLVRYLADGQLQFLGRLDNQVKLRGFRIEVGEIEALLRTHPAVADVAVVLREEAGEKRIVAYCLAAEAAPSASDLRSLLRERLPEHMIPAAFVFLDRLPLLPNGKLDRRALPAPQGEAPPAEPTGDAAGPRDTLERQLLAVWKRTLGVKRVGIRDSFFDLGGHSLLALRLFDEIERTLAQRLPLSLIFQAPTVEQMAGVLHKDGYRPHWTSLVPIQPQGTRPPFFCVHGGGGYVVFLKDLAAHLGPDQPFYGIQPAHLGDGPRHHSIEAMAEHYLGEIRRAQPEGPYRVGGASYGGVIAYEIAQRLSSAGEEVALLALFDTHAPGYGRSRPGPGRWLRRLLTQAYRVEHHVVSLLLLEPERRGRYVREKLERIRYETESSMIGLAKRVRRTQLSLAGPGGSPPEPETTGYMDLLRRYQPHPYPGRVTLFRAGRQWPVERPLPCLGWSTLAEGGLEIVPVPGFHAALLQEPHVRVSAEKLRERITASAHTARAHPQTG